jgi:hypothetical protein
MRGIKPCTQNLRTKQIITVFLYFESTLPVDCEVLLYGAPAGLAVIWNARRCMVRSVWRSSTSCASWRQTLLAGGALCSGVLWVTTHGIVTGRTFMGVVVLGGSLRCRISEEHFMRLSCLSTRLSAWVSSQRCNPLLGTVDPIMQQYVILRTHW